MSRPLRLEYPGSLWHVTARGNNRQLIYADDADRDFFLQLLGESAERFRWIVTSYVLMPNHYHLVVQLMENTLSRGMKWLNGRYGQHFNRRHRRVGHLFQGRFKGILVDKESYQLEVLRYVVLNPVRARMTARPEDYKWSSHRAVLGDLNAPGWLAVDDALVQFAPTREEARRLYRQFVDDGIRCDIRLWDKVVGQIYLGRDEWIDLLRERVQLRPRSQEHPRTQTLLRDCKMQTVIAIVADTFSVPADRVRCGRGGVPRMAAAWIAAQHGLLKNCEIAAALCLRSPSEVSYLVRRCDRELASNRSLRETLELCRSTIGRKNSQLQT